MLTIAEQEAQTAFLDERRRYHAAKAEFATHRLAGWQLQVAREQYAAAIARFALVCGVVPNWEFSTLSAESEP